MSLTPKSSHGRFWYLLHVLACSTLLHRFGRYLITSFLYSAGPLEDAYAGWTHYLNNSFKENWSPQDGEWHIPPDHPVPSNPKNEIIRITKEDGHHWSKWVILGPVWEEYVSPQWYVYHRILVLISNFVQWGRFLRWCPYRRGLQLGRPATACPKGPHSLRLPFLPLSYHQLLS